MERLEVSLANLAKLTILCAPGSIVIFLLPVSRLIAASHGLVGVGFGIIFIVGLVITNKIIWIATGCDWMEELNI